MAHALPPLKSLRRSPRGHKESAHTTLNVKPASINWDEHPILFPALLGAMESNHRWREGLFPSHPVSRAAKVMYYDEIARAIFSRDPAFRALYRRRPAGFARAVKDKLDSLQPQILVLPMANEELSQLCKAYLPQVSIFAWRSTHQLESPQTEIPLWRPTLPIELQYHIISLAIYPTPAPAQQTLDYPLAARLGSVNSAWCAYIDPHLYHTVTLRHQSRYSALFGRRSFAARPTNPLMHTRRLVLHVPPPEYPAFTSYTSYGRAGAAEHAACYMDAPGYVPPEVSFDMHSAREQFGVVQRLPRGAHVQAFANQAACVYRLLFDLRATVLHLFISSPIDGGVGDGDGEGGGDGEGERERARVAEEEGTLWTEAMAGHLAALKMLDNVRELNVDGELYLALLPKCIKGWATSENWQVILSVVKEENEIALPTLIDGTSLEKVTFQHKHVPTLAFLARMALAPNVKHVELSGWNRSAELPVEWRDFVKKEREEGDPNISWMD
ncbi:hypothetical protein BOTBODRAFT_59601 [Botryobasidium botryosum FD-172 SS1]|uniref:Uncharacterized protein n=1 Tax=Botryobasidium botryosum (strain FD-172 SS1) TaxID=930990 RepID=A0A067M8Z1_BOTB1|nr:hypothetical protein BOTBODRAFT_59601 [Botryobasidium botryosum FD-172 SS1]